MIPLHAPDRVGKAAHDASQFADALVFNLLAAKSQTLTPDKRREALERVFLAWPALCRDMAALETAAPNSSRAGAERSAKARDLIERREGAA